MVVVMVRIVHPLCAVPLAAVRADEPPALNADDPPAALLTLGVVRGALPEADRVGQPAEVVALDRPQTLEDPARRGRVRRRAQRGLQQLSTRPSLDGGAVRSHP